MALQRIFFPTEGAPLKALHTFSPLEGQPRGHFTRFSLLERHPGMHFTIFFLQGGRVCRKCCHIQLCSVYSIILGDRKVDPCHSNTVYHLWSKHSHHCQVTIKLPHSWCWHFIEMTCIYHIIDDLNRLPLKLFCKHEFDPTKQGVGDLLPLTSENEWAVKLLYLI